MNEPLPSSKDRGSTSSEGGGRSAAAVGAAQQECHGKEAMAYTLLLFFNNCDLEM